MEDGDGMVGGVVEVTDDAHVAVGVGGSGEGHSLEVGGGDCLRAAEGEEESAWFDGLYGALVDVAVGFESVLE